MESEFSLIEWLRRHAHPLETLNPDGPLDDLEPLRPLVRDARVVAIGECSHFIEEFSALRQRVLRFLVGRCGFRGLAFEAGFPEGFALDAWARSEGPPDALDRFERDALPLGVAPLLERIRRRNREQTEARPLGFVGIDLPRAGGSLAPALQPVRKLLERVDPEAIPILERVEETAAAFNGGTMAVAAPRWEALGDPAQSRLDADLLWLLLRFRSLEPLYEERSDAPSVQRALRCLEAGVHTSAHLRAMADLYRGGGLSGGTSGRELFMAESVGWHLKRAGPDARFVLAAHNAHIQKTPAVFDGHLTALPMGQHLHRLMGSSYVAIALTSTAGRTAEMHVDASAPFGFRVEDAVLGPPEEGSVENGLVRAGLGSTLVELRGPASGEPGGASEQSAGESEAKAAEPAFNQMRMQSAHIHLPVREAFDAVLNVAETRVSASALDRVGRWRGSDA
jgi:erythromycin esterase